MARTIPTPAIPHGAHFNSEASVLENASAAWEADKALRRKQGEHNAKVLARRIFRTDEFSFEYDARIGLDVPSFEVDDELLIFNGSDFSLVEFCSVCGREPKGRRFKSLSGLGAAIEERDEDPGHVCRVCLATGRKK